MTEAAETTSIIQYSVDQAGQAIIPFFTMLLKFTIVLALIALFFMFVKFLIIKAIKKAKSDTGTKTKSKVKEDGQQYYLSNEELEIIRSYNKLSEDKKQEIKEKMNEYIKNIKI